MPQGNPFTSAMAPAAMAGIAPDLAADQTQLLRQQQLADLLRRQGMEPMGPTEMVSGWAVKKSPLEGVAKIAQALGGQYLASQADEQQLALSQALRQRQLDSFDSIIGYDGGGGNKAAQAVQQWGDANGDSGPPNPALVQQVQQTMPQQSPAVTNLINSTREAYKAGNTELANKLALNLLELTGNQKDWAATGRDPKMIGKMLDAEARTKGVYKMEPGTTNVDFLTGTQTFQPKVGEGMVLNNGGVSVAPGYVNANAEIAGRQAGAVAGAQAENEMVTVQTPDGPKMMTKAQAVALSGGGSQPPAQQSGGGVSATNVGNMRPPGASKGFQKFDTPEQGLAAMDAQIRKYGERGINTLAGIIEKWSPPNENDTPRLIANAAKRLGIDPKAPLDLNNPVVRQAVTTAIALQERPLSAHNGGAKQSPGITLKSGSAETFEKESAGKAAESLAASREKARAADEEINVINESRAAIKAGAFQGMGADIKTDAVKIAQSLGIPVDGSKAANTDYLRSTLGKGMLDNAKKLGVNPTDADARRLDVIIGTIGKDPNAMGKLLDWRESLADKTINLHNKDVESAMANGAKFPYEMRVQRTKPEAKIGNGQGGLTPAEQKELSVLRDKAEQIMAARAGVRK